MSRLAYAAAIQMPPYVLLQVTLSAAQSESVHLVTDLGSPARVALVSWPEANTGQLPSRQLKAVTGVIHGLLFCLASPAPSNCITSSAVRQSGPVPRPCDDVVWHSYLHGLSLFWTIGSILATVVLVLKQLNYFAGSLAIASFA